MLSNGLCFYCQKCLAANPFGQELCVRCGTRLMLVVEPAAVRYEEDGLRSTPEDHLLERVSALENTLGRITDKLGQMLDLLLRQARNSYMDHLLLETLIGALGEAGVIDESKLDEIWRERCKTEDAEQEKKEQPDSLEILKREILANYKGNERAKFEGIICEGLDIFSSDKEKGLAVLARAFPLANFNTPLVTLLGEGYFEIAHYGVAALYLAVARRDSQAYARLSLMLGICMAEEYSYESALKFLRESIKYGGSSYAAHYAIGRLFASKKMWKEALSEFSIAVQILPSAEIQCVMGCVYFELDTDHLAARYLQSALKLDKRYAVAHFMLGLIHARAGRAEQAKKAIEKALQIEPENRTYRRALQRITKEQKVKCRAPIFDFEHLDTENLLFCCDERLNEALRKSALEFHGRDEAN